MTDFMRSMDGSGDEAARGIARAMAERPELLGMVLRDLSQAGREGQSRIIHASARCLSESHVSPLVDPAVAMLVVLVNEIGMAAWERRVLAARVAMGPVQ